MRLGRRWSSDVEVWLVYGAVLSFAESARTPARPSSTRAWAARTDSLHICAPAKVEFELGVGRLKKQFIWTRGRRLHHACVGPGPDGPKESTSSDWGASIKYMLPKYVYRQYNSVRAR